MKYHHPHHVYLDNTIYFLTARTYNKKHYLNTDSKKQLLLNKIRQTLTDFDFKFYAWVILNNHYQIEFKTRRDIDLSEIMNKVNGGRKVWQNYWDYCIRDEK
ncbi:MAG: transposase, partial [bacterium]